MRHSLDQLIGAQKDRGWRFESKRLCGLEVDHQLHFDRLLYRKVGWFFTFQDAPGILADKTESIAKAGSITHQAASDGKVAQIVDSGQAIACRERHDLTTLGQQERVGLHDKAPHPRLNGFGKSSIDIAFRSGSEHEQLMTQRARRRLRVAAVELGNGIIRIYHEAEYVGAWNELLKQLELFRHEHFAQRGDASHVAARPIETGDQAKFDRIASGIEHDWNRCR